MADSGITVTRSTDTTNPTGGTTTTTDTGQAEETPDQKEARVHGGPPKKNVDANGSSDGTWSYPDGTPYTPPTSSGGTSWLGRLARKAAVVGATAIGGPLAGAAVGGAEGGYDASQNGGNVVAGTVGGAVSGGSAGIGSVPGAVGGAVGSGIQGNDPRQVLADAITNGTSGNGPALGAIGGGTGAAVAGAGPAGIVGGAVTGAIANAPGTLGRDPNALWTLGGGVVAPVVGSAVADAAGHAAANIPIKVPDLTPGPSADIGPDAQSVRDQNTKLAAMLANQTPTVSPGEAGVTVAPAALSTGATLAGPSLAGTTTATGATIDPVTLAQAIGAAQAAPATASTYGGATIDTAASDQSRAQQEQLADAITAAMNGTAPSVAQEQLKKAGDQAIAQQYALAASARGQNVGLGLRTAQQGAASIGAQNAQDAAILRAQEIATARGQLGDVLSGIRGADVSLASNQGGLTNAAGIAGAANLTDVSKFNTSATNDINKFNAGDETDVSKANAAAADARATALAQLIQNNSQFNAGQTNNTSQFNATATNKQAEDAATLAQNNSQFNATATNTQSGLQAQLDQKRASDELTAVMQGKQLDVTTMNDLITAINNGSLGLLDSDTKLKVEQMDADAKKQADRAAAFASLIGTAATVGRKAAGG